MTFLESSPATLPKEGIFVLVGIAVLVALYFILSAWRAKKKPEPIEEIKEEIEEKPAQKEDPNSFRPVVFIRTNKRGIDTEEVKKEEKNDTEESNS